MRSIVLPAVSAALLFSSVAVAQSTVGGATASSSPTGSIAAGGTAGTAVDPAKHKRHKASRPERAAERQANSASTYGSGSVYTDRDRATGAVSAGGSASGTGSQATSTSIDAYGSTTKQGSEGEVYGDSTATSTNPPK